MKNKYTVWSQKKKKKTQIKYTARQQAKTSLPGQQAKTPLPVQ